MASRLSPRKLPARVQIDGVRFSVRQWPGRLFIRDEGTLHEVDKLVDVDGRRIMLNPEAIASQSFAELVADIREHLGRGRTSSRVTIY